LRGIIYCQSVAGLINRRQVRRLKEKKENRLSKTLMKLNKKYGFKLIADFLLLAV